MSFRDRGNTCFRRQDYVGAMRLYTQGIDTLSAAGRQPLSAENKIELSLLYNNRAACELKLVCALYFSSSFGVLMRFQSI